MTSTPSMSPPNTAAAVMFAGSTARGLGATLEVVGGTVALDGGGVSFPLSATQAVRAILAMAQAANSEILMVPPEMSAAPSLRGAVPAQGDYGGRSG